MQPDQLDAYVRQAMLAEDQVILDAVLAGAGQTPPCGVRVRRKLGGPTQIEVDPTVPAWEVHDRF